MTSRNLFYSLTARIVFFAFFSIAIIPVLLTHKPPTVFGENSPQVSSTLKLIVRDSATGSALPAEVVSQAQNRVGTLWTNSKGQGNYQLSIGRNELEINAANHQSLRTHFVPDSLSVTNVTFWVDPLEPPEELRPEVISSKTRSGQALLHGHVFDSETGLPIKGARVQLERAGVKSQTSARGYFLLYGPVLRTDPTEEMPGSDNLNVYVAGFKTYRRVNVTIAEGATHFIIDMSRGEGVTEKDDTHKLKLSPEQLYQSEPGAVATGSAAVGDHQKRTTMSLTHSDPVVTTTPRGLPARGPRSTPGSDITGEGVSQSLPVTVPTSIRVGSNCPSGRTSCTTFNVYSLDNYVGTGLDDEWFSSWNVESLKAGAIAYRSYGVWFVYHPISANYDICNTTSCQAHDPTDSSTRTIGATNNTTGMIVTDSTGNNPFFAEYAAENNDNFCADGFTGSPSANWPCLSDPVDAGQAFNGHGRGMCQWGTQRWAVNQVRDYVWIVNHYYNNNGSPSGARSGVLQNPTPTPTPTPAPMLLMLDSSGPSVDQVAGMDSVLFLRDPLPVVNAADLFHQGSDRNTRVIVFVSNLQLAQGETSSAVIINLIDANNQSHDIPAEDVRPVPDFNFTQVIFRLPNNLPAGICTLRVNAHAQLSNAGTIRIRD